MDEYGSEPKDVLREWERIVRRVRRNAAEAVAGLDGPGDPAAIEAAQRRMGVVFPPELRAWLGASGLGRLRTDDGRNAWVAFGHDGVLPTGGLLLCLTDIERVHGFKQSLAESDPPDGDHVDWCSRWVPITAERDGFSGRFLDTRTGAVGAWSEGELPSEGLHPSLSAFLRAAADELEGVPAAPGDGPDVRGRQGPDDEAVRAWARRNGYAVNDRGRIPSAVREAWQAARAGG
ncbi:Lsr2 family DNA-binding protein [Kitasatospora arboriphila]|uniref:Lsr2 DNA-binding domain-containing protein n=2 Tax=Kitasatospora TaxID=2063 RepID=A0ABN1TEY5_9ACTN